MQNDVRQKRSSTFAYADWRYLNQFQNVLDEWKNWFSFAALA